MLLAGSPDALATVCRALGAEEAPPQEVQRMGSRTVYVADLTGAMDRNRAGR